MFKVFPMKSMRVLNKNYKERKYLEFLPKIVSGGNRYQEM